MPAAGKPCPPGCEVRGTCNRETGVCDCPPLTTGASCELNAVPTCRRLWGLELPIPPCQALTTEVDEWKAFPPSCECLAECHAVNLRVVYVDKCVNASQMRYHAQGDVGHPMPKTSYPWVDTHGGDPRWMRQAFTPDRRAPPLNESELSRRNLELASQLAADGAESVRRGLCSGRGLFTRAMPWTPPHKQSSGKHCHCLPGWFGETCQIGPGSPEAPQSKRHCVHRCSGRGICTLNFCHCVPGTWGVDCSFGEPDRVRAAAVAELQLMMAQGTNEVPSEGRSSPPRAEWDTGW